MCGCDLLRYKLSAAPCPRRLTDTYMLRRNSEVNRQYLPPKREFTVFVRCSALQERLYAAFLRVSERVNEQKTIRMEGGARNQTGPAERCNAGRPQREQGGERKAGDAREQDARLCPHAFSKGLQ